MMIPDSLLKKAGELKVTVPIALVVGLMWLGYKADAFTVGYFSEWFITRAEAQEQLGQLEDKVDKLEGKVDALGNKFDTQRVADIEREVFKIRIDQCMSAGTLRQLYTTQITALIAEWRVITSSPGNPPTLVSCEDL